MIDEDDTESEQSYARTRFPPDCGLQKRDKQRDYKVKNAAKLKRKGSKGSKYSNRSYEVGKGKPPKSGQFKKGQSGNPKGRSRGKKRLDLNLIIADVLNSLVTVQTPSGPKRIPILRAAIEKNIRDLIRRGRLGDLKMFFELADRAEKAGTLNKDHDREELAMIEQHYELMDNFRDLRLRFGEAQETIEQLRRELNSKGDTRENDV